MTSEQQQLLDQAHRTLGAAKLLFDNSFFRDTVSRAYYSMLYVAEAFLSESGSRIRSHKGVILAFGRDFANTGRVPVEYHRKLIDAERLRNKADYRHQEAITPDEAQRVITDAEQLLQLGQRLLNQQQMKQALVQTPQKLWQHYSQGITTPIVGSQLTAIARRALQDNLDPEAIQQMLLEAPYLQDLQQRQGPERAKEFARLAVRNARLQEQQSPHRLLQQKKGNDLEPEN